MKKFAYILFGLFYACSVFAEPLSREDVPEPLKPWIGWVLHNEKDVDCPFAYNDLSKTICIWPSELNLTFQKNSAVFSQKWEVFSDEIWILLPGNNKFWPQDIKVNGKKHPVGKRKGLPVVFIKEPGKYTISGKFKFDSIPEWIKVPKHTGLLKLAIKGKGISFPNMDNHGKLWLKQGGEDKNAVEKEDKLQLKVYRLIRDEIPLLLVTRVDLYISGKHREVKLGKAVANNFIPMRLKSDLPAKIEADGNLILQARPGKWTIEITSRHKGHVNELHFDPSRGFDVDEEVWVFEAKNHLRIVSIEGVMQIDPQQTTIPERWKKFSAYLMHSDDTMCFVEKKRGDPLPAPDQLNLHRTLWLDFNGTGYSIRDSIIGSMTTGWRLEMAPPVELGRVTVQGREQFITRLKGSDKAGVEMRYGNVRLEAESRLEDADNIPAVGWDRDFHSVKGILNLPPGWTLFDATGIDHIRQTWLKQWTLLDMFLVLIISLAVARLYSWPWGIIALAAMVLLNHEIDAPRWVWLNLLAAIALLRVVPKGKISSMINNYRMICIACLIFISLPFMVNQIRTGIYPQLEKPWQQIGMQQTQQWATTGKVAIDEDKGYDQKTRLSSKLPKTIQSLKQRMKEEAVSEDIDYLYNQQASQLKIKRLDPNAKIQTGPGIPNWQWRQINFSWNGPVEKDQEISFVFISPFMNLILAVLRVILLAILIYCLFRLSGAVYSKNSGFSFSSIKNGIFSIISVLLLSVIVCQAHADNSFPPEKLLDELKLKLTEKDRPPCAPNCALSPRMKVRITGNQLDIRIEFHSLHPDTAVPLPGSVQHWQPQIVLIDEKPVFGLYREPSTGYLWLNLPEGIHQIDIKGALPQRDVVWLQLPLKPHYVEINSEGWSVDGLYDNGVADTQLQFTRIRTDNDDKTAVSETFEPGLLPSFVKITRIFLLDLDWQIETIVSRVTPVGSAIAASIPLLAGESVTSDIRVENGNVLLNMAPDQKNFRWFSSLKIEDELALKAEDTLDWAEVWQVNIGTLWHAEISGIPVIHHQNKSGNWFPEWRPWPGEEIAIKITRPEGIKGQTHTIESSELSLSPGKRIRNAILNLKIKSSRGGSHTIKIPDNAKLQSVSINGKSQPVRQEKNSVTLPLTPGQQDIKLVWRELKDVETILKTSLINLGMKSVDSFISVSMPRDRWILFCGGPYVGPAVLFWGVVFVIILLSFGLGRLNITPLKFHHWALLSLGLTQGSLLIAIPVAGWFLVLGYRKQVAEKLSNFTFNLFQVFIILLSIVAFGSLLFGIKQGLLGYPNMQISGNGSGNYLLKWYQDISGEILPQAWVFSLPLTIYRIAILAWALWIAFAFIKWLRWAWECFSARGLWRKIDWNKLRNRPWKRHGDRQKNAETEGDLGIRGG